MKICSLLPSATEIVCALGLEKELVGVTHECVFPPAARQKPRIVRTTIDQDRLSSHAIHQAVEASLRAGQSLYVLDQELLERLQPDLIITQDLCEVCAIDSREVNACLGTLASRPQILSLHPHTLEEALADILRVGHAADREDAARAFVARLRERIAAVRQRVAGAVHRPRVLCLEWMDPVMNAGHWVPELVVLAGGHDVLGRAGELSRVVRWEDVVAADPEMLIVMPCGFPLERTRQEISALTARASWRQLSAVSAGRVFLVNGPAYFNQSGPRIVDGVELLATLLHPDRCRYVFPADAVARLEPAA